LSRVDTNILVYAHRAELPKHAAAKRRLLELAEGAAAWAIPVFCVGEFLRVITHPRLFDPPHTAAEACAAVAVLDAGAVGNLVFDAQVVALCRESGVASLLTEDRDFDRFAGFTTTHL
jgi:predicted nucleic acid-binding protein